MSVMMKTRMESDDAARPPTALSAPAMSMA